MRHGKGAITVNGRDFVQYFTMGSARAMVKQALQTVEMSDKFDILILANGGGCIGQAGAVRLGISRALILLVPDDRPALKAAGFLRRDPRAKERKKYGLKKARKAPQYSKR